MSHLKESEVEIENSLNIPEILADFFLQKIDMLSHSDDSDDKHKSKRKKLKHKKRKHKKSKHIHRSSSSETSSKTSDLNNKVVDDVSSSEEMGIKRLKKIKKLKLQSNTNSAAQLSEYDKESEPSTASATEKPVFYGPSIELLLSGMDSNNCNSKANDSSEIVNSEEKVQCSSDTNLNNFIESTKTEDLIEKPECKKTLVDSALYSTTDPDVEKNTHDNLKNEEQNLVSNDVDDFKNCTQSVLSSEISQTEVQKESSPDKNSSKADSPKNYNEEYDTLVNKSIQKDHSLFISSYRKKPRSSKSRSRSKSKSKSRHSSPSKKDSSLKTENEKKKEHSRSLSRSRSQSQSKHTSPRSKYKRRTSRSLSSDSYSTSSNKKRKHSLSRSCSRGRIREKRRKSNSRSSSRSKKYRRSCSYSPFDKYSHKNQRSRSHSYEKNRRQSRSNRRNSNSRQRDCSSSKSRHRDCSLSKTRHRRKSRRSESHSRSKSKSKSRHGSRSRSKSKNNSNHSSPSKEKSRSRSKERKSSQSSTKIDQAKVLETARKNVLKMMKSGTLPEGLPVENLKKEQLISIQAGGKSVQELTDFCQRLSQKENEPYVSENEDNEEKPDDETGFIHHPFKVKEPGMIKLNIKNAVQLPIKTHAQKIAETTRLSSQFPVSSGNQHKQKELEWIPVVPESTKTEIKPAEIIVSSTAAISNAVVPSDIPVPALPPPVSITYPCPSSAEASLVEDRTPISAHVIPPPPLPVSTLSLSPPMPLPDQHMMLYQASTQPIVETSIAPSQPTLAPYTSVTPFPTSSSSSSLMFKPPKKFDISAIVTKRFQALTKLQENPNDPEALRTIQEAQECIQEWVQSKQVPGLFTGSTDAKILSVAELCGPLKYKPRKDILSQAPPVTEGKGMSLLKKMGWNPGEGLGKNKEGSLEPLVLDIKTDKKGLVSTGENSRKAVSSFMKELQGKHPVSALMELCSKRKWKPPLYTCILDHGPPHKKIFSFKVEVNGIEYQPLNPSSNKKVAKADAAVLALQSLNILPKA